MIRDIKDKNMFYKCCADKSKRPVCLLFCVIGHIVAIYGLWVHSWIWIVVAVVVFILGYLFVMGPKKEKPVSPAAEPTSEPEEPTEGPSEPIEPTF